MKPAPFVLLSGLARTSLAVCVLLYPSLLISQSYPIKVEKTISFANLDVSHNRLSIHFDKGALALIECEKGVTGAAVIGKGNFSYATKDTQTIHDSFTNAMLRFNPSEYAVFIAPVGGQTGSQTETIQQAMDLIKRVFRRLYHVDDNASVPDAGILAGVLVCDNLGEITVLEGGQKSGVFSRNERRWISEGGEAVPTPTFQNISNNWMPRVNPLQMDGIWRREGIIASGDNYFYLPAPSSGKSYSQRFDPTSVYFQAWFGVYVVKDNEAGRYGYADGKPNAKAITLLSIADQRAWLKSLAGVQDPFVTEDTSTPMTVQRASVAGMDGWKILSRLRSNVDVGDKNLQSGRAEFLIVPAVAWKELVGSYDKVALDIVTYVLYDAGRKESYMIYYNGVDFTDKRGQRHRTLPEIQSEMETMVGNFKVPRK